MSHIRAYYADLRQRVRESRTRQNLRVLDKYGKAKLRELSSPFTNPQIRRQASAEYRRTRKLISKRMRMLRE